MTVDKVELRRLAEECVKHGDNWYESRNMAAFPEFHEDQDFVIAANPSTVLAILDDCQKAEAKRDAALADLEACRKDAERYRWIRERVGVDFMFGDYNPYLPGSSVVITQKDKETTDAAIDAAMAHAKENGND